MTNFFADTSAIAKRYVVESGTNWVRSWTNPAAGNVVVMSDLTPVEMFSLLARKQREGLLSPSNFTQVSNTFLFHIEHEYLTTPLDAPVLVAARGVIGKYALRTLDAIQLSAALNVAAAFGEPMTFVSADRNLLNAALAEGFNVDDPNVHP